MRYNCIYHLISEMGPQSRLGPSVTIVNEASPVFLDKPTQMASLACEALVIDQRHAMGGGRSITRIDVPAFITE